MYVYMFVCMHALRPLTLGVWVCISDSDKSLIPMQLYNYILHAK